MLTPSEARAVAATIAQSWRMTHALRLKLAGLSLAQRSGPVSLLGTSRQLARIHLVAAREADLRALAWERLPPGAPQTASHRGSHGTGWPCHCEPDRRFCDGWGACQR